MPECRSFVRYLQGCSGLNRDIQTSQPIAKPTSENGNSGAPEPHCHLVRPGRDCHCVARTFLKYPQNPVNFDAHIPAAPKPADVRPSRQRRKLECQVDRPVHDVEDTRSGKGRTCKAQCVRATCEYSTALPSPLASAPAATVPRARTLPSL